VENSFKHGIMAMGNSFIHIKFELESNLLNVNITNSKSNHSQNKVVSGKIGMNNSKKRFDLIYNKNYSYAVNETETTYLVNVKVPLYEN
jgi:LytS/YehU family sensor histidine kinase